jgi:hypothetical protein
MRASPQLLRNCRHAVAAWRRNRFSAAPRARLALRGFYLNAESMVPDRPASRVIALTAFAGSGRPLDTFSPQMSLAGLTSFPARGHARLVFVL